MATTLKISRSIFDEEPGGNGVVTVRGPKSREHAVAVRDALSAALDDA